MSYLIYGKVVKTVQLGKHIVEPQSRFRALNYDGVQVNKLADADDYATKEDAQATIDWALRNLRKHGKSDCILFEIRKAK